MRYEHRKQLVSAWLFNLLKRYEPPSHLDENAAREEMVLIVEDINSELPNLDDHAFKEHLEKVARYVRKSQVSRKWPSIAMFMKGVRENSKNFKLKEQIGTDTNDWSNPLVINAKRIRNGEAVCQTYLSGTRLKEMLNKGLITSDNIKPYKLSLDNLVKINEYNDV